MPYRLTIVAPKEGIERNSIIWHWFPSLFPVTTLEDTVTYETTIAQKPYYAILSSLDGFVEDEDILSWKGKEV